MKAGTILWPTGIWVIGHEAHVAPHVANAAPHRSLNEAADAIRVSPGLHAKALRFARRATGFATKSQVPIGPVAR